MQELKQVLEVLDSHPRTVCAVLSGHDHEGKDNHGGENDHQGLSRNHHKDDF